MVNPTAAKRQSSTVAEVRIREPETSSSPFDTASRPAAAIALSEALCSIDEDNKHTAQIEDLLEQVRESAERRAAAAGYAEVDDVDCIIETYTDQLAFTEVGRNSLKVRLLFLV